MSNEPRRLRRAKENRLTGSQFTAIGAFEELTVGFFSTDKKAYNKILIREQVEVLSLLHAA
jgi:predicted DNA-binding protein with PD1-like motif